MESTESLIGNILCILQFGITKRSSNENKKNYIEKLFQEILNPFEGINTEALLNAFVKEKFNFDNYEVKLLDKRLTQKIINQKKS